MLQDIGMCTPQKFRQTNLETQIATYLQVNQPGILFVQANL